MAMDITISRNIQGACSRQRISGPDESSTDHRLLANPAFDRYFRMRLSDMRNTPSPTAVFLNDAVVTVWHSFGCPTTDGRQGRHFVTAKAGLPHTRAVVNNQDAILSGPIRHPRHKVKSVVKTLCPRRSNMTTKDIRSELSIEIIHE
jgi:hypothetical protein